MKIKKRNISEIEQSRLDTTFATTERTFTVPN